MIKVKNAGEKVLEIEVDGKLLHDDYKAAIPILEQTIKDHGKLRCVMEIRNIKGLEPRTMIDEVKFDLKHLRQIDRCAILCEQGWVAWLTRLWSLVMPFTKVKRFEVGQLDAARAWASADE